MGMLERFFSGGMLFLTPANQDYPQCIVKNKPNLDCFQHKYWKSEAENFGSVCLMVCKKIDAQTERVKDRQCDNTSVFFLRKKAQKTEQDRTVRIFLEKRESIVKLSPSSSLFVSGSFIASTSSSMSQKTPMSSLTASWMLIFLHSRASAPL